MNELSSDKHDAPCASCEVPRQILERIRPAVKRYALEGRQAVEKCKRGDLPAHYLETLQRDELARDALLCAVDDILSITKRRSLPSAEGMPQHPTGISFEKWLSYQPCMAEGNVPGGLYTSDTVRAAWIAGSQCNPSATPHRLLLAGQVHRPTDGKSGPVLWYVSLYEFPEGTKVYVATSESRAKP